MPRGPRVVLAVVPAVAAVALLTAGCGGPGSASPGIASVAGSTVPASTTTQGGSGAPAAAGGAPGGTAHFQIAMRVGTVDGEKFSQCMRKNGIANFPDPNGQGVIAIDSGMGIDPSSPKFQSARTTCMKLLPNGGQPTPAQIAQQQKQMLAFSSCMRAHGLKNFPDPSNGGLQIRVQPGSDLDPGSPQFQNAQKACQKYGPFKGGPGG